MKVRWDEGTRCERQAVRARERRWDEMGQDNKMDKWDETG